MMISGAGWMVDAVAVTPFIVCNKRIGCQAKEILSAMLFPITRR
jgi:hypothetical protein